MAGEAFWQASTVGGSASLLRQGGSATDWNSHGTTTQTVTDYHQEIGVRQLGPWGPGDSSVAVTFQTPFAYPPHVMVSVSSIAGSTRNIVSASSVTATGFTIYAYTFDGGVTIKVAWRAIGPT